MIGAPVSEHAAEIAALKNQIADLELSLSTANEHSDLLQEHLYQVSDALAVQVRERQSAELKLSRLLEAIRQEKADLEIMVQILIEEGDHSAAEGEQARIDGLTQVANRRGLDEHLLKEWDRHRAARQPLSLLLCDVDYFKSYNDFYGHLAGDDCLRSVGEAISSSIRGNDLVARYGGEEFAVVLPQTTLQAALLVAERTRGAVVNARIAHAGSPCGEFLTVSIGVGYAILTGAEQGGPESLIGEADEALYLAKSRGRNRVEYAPAHIHETTHMEIAASQ